MTAKDTKYLTGMFEELKTELLVALAAKPDDRPLLTSKDVAVRLGVNERTARNYIESGRLASVKIEGVRRVEPRVLDAFVASGRDAS